jgi:hypothetical protein
LVVVWLGHDAEVRRTPELPLFLANASLLLIPLFAASLARLTGLALGPRFILPLFLIALKSGLAKRHPGTLAAAA